MNLIDKTGTKKTESAAVIVDLRPEQAGESPAHTLSTLHESSTERTILL